MFEKWKKKREKSLVASAFSEFISEQSIENIYNENSNRENKSTIIKSQLILLQLKNDDIDELPFLLTECLNLITELGGEVEQSFSGIFIVHFSIMKNPETDASEKREKIPTIFLSKFKQNIRLVHCHAESTEVNFGLYRYQIMKRSNQILKLLFDTEFGYATEGPK